MPGYAVSLVASSLLACASLATAAEEFSITRLGGPVFAIVRNDPPGFAVESNSGFIECRDQIVVVDTQSNEATTRRVLAAIRKQSNKPIGYIINTHWHDDHIVGNRIYREAFPGARFVAHQASLTYLRGDGKKNRDKFHRAIPDALGGLRKTLESGKTSKGQPLTDEQRASLASDIRLAEGYLTVPDNFTPVLADVPVSEKLEIREPGCAIDVLALGNAHTTGDLVVHVADAGVVFVGDIIGWPVPLVGADQSRVREWSGTLQRVRGLGAKVIVPGHGPVMRDYAHFDRISTLMTTIVQRVDEARARSETLEAARSHIDLSDLRRQFAGDSPVHATLFDAYVAGPAVTNAWNIAPSAAVAAAVQADDTGPAFAGEPGYVERLCRRLEDPAARQQLVLDRKGVDDVNNDGTPERIESCWGGTANEPCAEYYNGNEMLLIKESGFEWKDLAVYDQRSFRHEGRTFFLHGYDDAMAEPKYVSYITPANEQFIVCEFRNRTIDVLKEGDPKLCASLLESPPVQLSTISGHPPAFERRDTTLEAGGELDIDNDGRSEQVVKLVYASGAGRGCAYTYFELRMPDGSLRRDATSQLLNGLQMLEEDGFAATTCGEVENRLIRHEGKVYLDSRGTYAAAFPHQIRVIEQGRVQDVCTFGVQIETVSSPVRY